MEVPVTFKLKDCLFVENDDDGYIGIYSYEIIWN